MDDVREPDDPHDDDGDYVDYLAPADVRNVYLQFPDRPGTADCIDLPFYWVWEARPSIGNS